MCVYFRHKNRVHKWVNVCCVFCWRCFFLFNSVVVVCLFVSGRILTATMTYISFASLWFHARCILWAPLLMFILCMWRIYFNIMQIVNVDQRERESCWLANRASLECFACTTTRIDGGNENGVELEFIWAWNLCSIDCGRSAASPLLQNTRVEQLCGHQNDHLVLCCGSNFKFTLFCYISRIWIHRKNSAWKFHIRCARFQLKIQNMGQFEIAIHIRMSRIMSNLFRLRMVQH